MARSVEKGEQQRLRRELCEKAVAFYAEHNVPKTVEKLFNEMFVAAPKDVYGYMAEYFSELAVAPVICAGSRCTESVDERGGRALDISIHCTVHGVDRYVTSVSVPIDPRPPPTPSPPINSSPSKTGGKKKGTAVAVEAVEELDQRDKKDNDTADPFDSFNTYIIPALLSRSPNQQAELDKIITSLRDKDGRELHSSAILATSLAVAKSAAQLSSLPLYEHLANALSSSSSSSSSSSLSLPTPVISLLAGGPGKLRVREFCIVPLPGRILSERVSALCSVHRSLGSLLSAKTGVSSGPGPSGVYCPALDKLESGMELVREAVEHSGLSLGEDLSILIDVGADRLFDQEKCKYELVTGQWKTTDELVAIYSDLLTSHPALMGFIDPLHHKDVEGWKKLQEMLGSKCLLVAEKTLAAGLPVSPRNSSSEGAEESEGAGDGLQLLSCAALTLDATLSDTATRASSAQNGANYIMMCAPPTLTMNPLLVDLAVALQCVLVRMGAPVGLTSTCLLSRMLQIREELCQKGTYEPAKALVFSCSPLKQQ